MALSPSTILESVDEVSLPIRPPRAVRQRKARIASLVGVLLVTGAIYALPWMAVRIRDRSILPPAFGPDFYAYLNFSHIFTILGVPDHDPWYGAPIQPKFGHATFRIAFIAFGAVRSLVGNDVVTSIVWSIGWSVLIAYSLWLLLQALFEQTSALLLFAATSMMVFFSLSALNVNLAAWFHLLSGTLSDELPLPFIRMFFPQIAIPLLAFYFLFCKLAWDHGQTRAYVTLAVIQIATFVSFPYGSVFIALATLIFLSLGAKRSDFRKKVVQFGILGVVSLVADKLYLWFALSHGGPAHQAPLGASLFHFDLAQLHAKFGGTVMLLLAISVLLLFSRQRDSSRLMIVSIGLANVFMLVADCIIDPRFLVSHHAGYFVQISLGLELCAVFCSAEKVFSQRYFKVAAVAACLLFVSNGALASCAAVRRRNERNINLGSFATVMSGLNLSSEDLVIAPGKEVDDMSTAVPLVSRAHVLYTPEAEILLGPGDESLMNGRHAAYLYLSGRDSNWVSTRLARHLLPSEILRLGQRFTLESQRRPDLVEKDVRDNLLPELLALDNGVVPLPFTSSHRVVILDYVSHPIFDDSHVNRLLRVSEDYEIGPIRVRAGSARN